MIKKISLGVVALVAVAGGVAGMSAFEAHVINVTAKIENALRVDTEALDFGTVFPQEVLERPLEIALSSSFLDEDDADDVEYIIRQKPKCGLTTEGGTVLDHTNTATGHVRPDGSIDCGDAPVDADGQLLPGDWGVLPSLCEYISKHPDNRDDDGSPSDNDGTLNSFHVPYTVDPNTGVITWNDTIGRLAKTDNDRRDIWTIDLAVPCFGGHCAQDWESFVRGVNPEANASDYVQPIENEHKIFGCDLWVEVTGVSRFSDPPTPPGEPT